MAAPTRVGKVIILAVADDTINSSEQLYVQSMFAKAGTVVTDGAGNTVWEATAAGQSITFPNGLRIDGLNATGTGPVYVYLT